MYRKDPMMRWLQTAHEIKTATWCHLNLWVNRLYFSLLRFGRPFCRKTILSFVGGNSAIFEVLFCKNLRKYPFDSFRTSCSLCNEGILVVDVSTNFPRIYRACQTGPILTLASERLDMSFFTTTPGGFLATPKELEMRGEITLNSETRRPQNKPWRWVDGWCVLQAEMVEDFCRFSPGIVYILHCSGLWK